MDAATSVGAVVVDELKKQAREQGYLVWSVREDAFWFWAALGVYFLLGYAWGSSA